MGEYRLETEPGEQNSLGRALPDKPRDNQEHLPNETRDALMRIGASITPIIETADAQTLTRLSDILGLARLETERQLTIKTGVEETFASLSQIGEAITPLIETADAHELTRLGHILRMARFEMEKLLKTILDDGA
ncbi:MAG: hypothetical protein MPJ78_19020 [Hyphomicrobiaceae bacterium]|nr:hypothetical protein [Hyphomicrobiaceae bacterium]